MFFKKKSNPNKTCWLQRTPIANAIARVYLVWFQMSSALSRKGTECCRRTWKPHSTTFRTCNDQKKTPWNFHFHTQVWLPRPRWWCLPLCPVMRTQGPTKRPTRQTPHRTINLSFLNHIELHQQPQPTLTLRWQSTSVPVLVRCKLKHLQYLFRVRLCLLIWLKAIPTFYAAFNLPWCKPG